MTHFWVILGPLLPELREEIEAFWRYRGSKNGSKMGISGVPGQKWKNGSNLVLENVAPTISGYPIFGSLFGSISEGTSMVLGSKK